MSDNRLTDDQLKLLAYSFGRERFRADAMKRGNANAPVLVHVEYSVFEMAARALDELIEARSRLVELEDALAECERYDQMPPLDPFAHD